ncbi:hypothetical protein TNCV_2428761 [Trichonephila clavipes]|nr:hypothetical protein TNCV_2428761 [Trichonephila clavipes]
MEGNSNDSSSGGVRATIIASTMPSEGVGMWCTYQNSIMAESFHNIVTLIGQNSTTFKRIWNQWVLEYLTEAQAGS